MVNPKVLAGIGVVSAALVSEIPQVRNFAVNALNSASSTVDGIIDNAFEGINVSGGRYALMEYTIQKGDNATKLSHGNPLVAEYISKYAKSMYKNDKYLQPGTKLIMPVPTNSKDGKTIQELLRELYDTNDRIKDK